jgi:hypothetical protein
MRARAKAWRIRDSFFVAVSLQPQRYDFPRKIGSIHSFGTFACQRLYFFFFGLPALDPTPARFLEKGFSAGESPKRKIGSLIQRIGGAGGCFAAGERLACRTCTAGTKMAGVVRLLEGVFS